MVLPMVFRRMEHVLTDVMTDGTLRGNWVSVPGETFIYADGTPSPPELLRDPPEQNYLSNQVYGIGLGLFGIAVLWVLLAAVFVIVKRAHKVIKGNQPEFLLILLGGALTMSCGILTLSFDEDKGWSGRQLSSACAATPWLISLGFITIYCALFSKVRMAGFRLELPMRILRW